MNFFLNIGKLLVLVLLCGFGSCDGGGDPPFPPVIELPEFEAGVATGEIDNAEIDEASGLAASGNFAGNFWVNNDSGDKNRLFLINNKGIYQGSIYLNGVQNRDWEDIATTKIGNDNYLYVADIGDNEASYGNEYSIYKVKEPNTLPTKNNDQYLSNFETIKFRYSDGARDAETILIDHSTKDIYIVTKRESRIRLYKLASPQAINTLLTAEFLNELPIGGQLNNIPTGATAGSISADNKEIMIKSYFQIYYWKLNSTETIQQALARKYDKTLPYSPEPQGEGISWDPATGGYYTIGEAGEAKNIVNLYYYKRK